MFEKVPQARYTLIERGDRIYFVVPSQRGILSCAFLCCWLAGWVFGEVFVTGTLLFKRPPSPSFLFMVPWLILWTIGGITALYQLLWQLAGREVISASRTILSLRREIYGIGRTRNYDASEVNNLRLGPTANNPYQAYWGTRPGNLAGPMAFDYGARTFRFGSGLDEAEARQIIERMKLALPEEDR